MNTYDCYENGMREDCQGDWVWFDDVEEIIKALIEASKPFASGDVVTETSGTIPLTDRLKAAIELAEKAMA